MAMSASRRRAQDLYLDAGSLFPELSQYVRKHVGCQQIGCRDGHQALDLLRLTGGGERDTARRVAHGAHVFGKLHASLRQDQRFRDPFEKRDTKRFLQRRHLPAQRRLGQAKCPCCCRQGAFFRGYEKGAGLIPVECDVLPVHANMYIIQPNFGNLYSFI